ncbi:MAG: tail fiber domain-containing protein [Proteobacteria bacterium]|nr:MAG: tail fiber domain-containing protein [Pseudomonadota bacterium]
MKNSRRDLLKAMTLGTGAVGAAKLPSTWTKPVVESVTIPAHAQTTSVPLGGARNFNVDIAFRAGTRLDGIANRDPSGNSIVSIFVSNAHAQVGPVSGRLKAYVESLGNGKFLVQVLVRVQGQLEGNVGLDESRDTNGGILHSIIGQAHAGFDGEACYNELLWQKRMEVKPDENGKYKSGWYENIAPADWCGGFGFVGNGDAALRLRLDDGVSPTSGVVTIRSVEGSLDVDVTPGASKLKADCRGMPCSEVPSDRNVKEGFERVAEQEILDKLANLPLEYWNYTGDASVRHIGPMAQDFHSTFEVGGSDRSINVVDANGVTMASIKALYRLVDEKDAQLARLEDELARIRKML